MTIINKLIDWLLKVYMELMVIVAPFRMAILILTIAILTPLIIKLVFYLARRILKPLNTILSKAYDKLGETTLNRRKNGKFYLPGTGLLDAILAVLRLCLTNLEGLLQKGSSFSPKLRKGYKWVMILCILGLPAWATIKPSSPVGVAWTKFESNLITNHLIALGYDPGTYRSLEQFTQELTESQEASAEPEDNKTYYITPHNESKKGVYIRKGTSKSYDYITLLYYGEKASFLEETTGEDGNPWYKIQTEKGVVGWVSSTVTARHER